MIYSITGWIGSFLFLNFDFLFLDFFHKFTACVCFGWSIVFVEPFSSITMQINWIMLIWSLTRKSMHRTGLASNFAQFQSRQTTTFIMSYKMVCSLASTKTHWWIAHSIWPSRNTKQPSFAPELKLFSSIQAIEYRIEWMHLPYACMYFQCQIIHLPF